MWWPFCRTRFAKTVQCFHRVPAWGLGEFSSGSGFYPSVALGTLFPFSLLYFSVILLGVWQYNLEEFAMILRLFLSNLLASLDMRQGLGVNIDQILVPVGLGWDREPKCQYVKWGLIRVVETTADNWVQMYCISISSKEAIWARV